METFELVAEKRESLGTGESRRLRNSGKVPAILYGAGKEPMSIILDHNEMLLHLEHEAFYSHILALKIGGKSEKVVLKDIQRHPGKPRILHLDLQRISDKQKLHMTVPLHFVNEKKCEGVKEEGGVISHLMSEVEVTCLPKDLPEYLEVDLTHVNIGEALHLSDISLPEGVIIHALSHGTEVDRAIVSVNRPRSEEEEALEAGVEEAAAIEGEAETKPSEESTEG